MYVYNPISLFDSYAFDLFIVVIYSDKCVTILSSRSVIMIYKMVE